MNANQSKQSTFVIIIIMIIIIIMLISIAAVVASAMSSSSVEILMTSTVKEKTKLLDLKASTIRTSPNKMREKLKI